MLFNVKKININIFSVNIFLFFLLILLNAFFIYAMFKASEMSITSVFFGNKAEQLHYDFSNFAYTTFKYLRAVTTTLMFGILVSLFIIIMLLLFWGKDREKIRKWRNIGFFCDYLELLDDNRIRINNTEFKLRKKQFETMELLAKNQIEGENLRVTQKSDDLELLNNNKNHLISENPTQVIKRLREELGSKIMEDFFITTERGRGYNLKVNPDNVKISKKNDNPIQRTI